MHFILLLCILYLCLHCCFCAPGNEDVSAQDPIVVTILTRARTGETQLCVDSGAAKSNSLLTPLSLQCLTPRLFHVLLALTAGHAPRAAAHCAAKEFCNALVCIYATLYYCCAKHHAQMLHAMRTVMAKSFIADAATGRCHAALSS